jgi:hypothetical protein
LGAAATRLAAERWVDLGGIARRLVEDGLHAFQTDLDELLRVIAGKLDEVQPDVVSYRNTDPSYGVDGAAVL